MSSPLRVAVAHACPSTRALLRAELAAHPRLQVVEHGEPADTVLMQPGPLPPGPDLILLAEPGEPGPALDAVLSAPADRPVDVVPLPARDPELVARTVRADLLPMLLAQAGAREPVTWCTPLPGPIDAGGARHVQNVQDTPFTVLAIGSGRGGVPALRGLLTSLPPDLPVRVVVAQHLPPGYRAALAARLPVRDDVRLVGVSVDGLFRTFARRHGAGVLGLVLGGVGRDGVQGATAVRAAGGTVLGQDEASTGPGLWGMPGALAAAGQADRLVPLADLPAALAVTLALPLPASLGRHARTDRPDLVVAGR